MKIKTSIPIYQLARFYQWRALHRRCNSSAKHLCSRCQTLISMSLWKSFVSNKGSLHLEDSV